MKFMHAMVCSESDIECTFDFSDGHGHDIRKCVISNLYTEIKHLCTYHPGECLILAPEAIKVIIFAAISNENKWFHPNYSFAIGYSAKAKGNSIAIGHNGTNNNICIGKR